MALTDKLTAIANAIREKRGLTKTLTLDQMAMEIAQIQTGGGSGFALYSGSFTPVENVLEATVDVGGPFTHFVLYAIGTVTGNSVKATNSFTVDTETPRCMGTATNNSGSSLSAVLGTDVMGTDNPKYKRFAFNNTQILAYSDSVHVTTSTPAGSCLGYFIAGVTYLWYAW